CEVRRQEGRADLVRSGRDLDARAHRRPAAAAEECLGSLLPAGRGRRTAPASAGRSGTAPSARLSRGAAATIAGRAEAAAALPVDELHALAVEQNLELLARHRSETGRRHVVAEDRG